MKKPRTNKSSRPLLAVAALVVAFSVVSAPMANALFFNYVRDAYTDWGSGAWTDLQAAADVAACGPVAEANAAGSWMVEPVTEILEASANEGYLAAFSSSASGYESWYKYAAFNDMANLTSYLDAAESWADAYYELAEAYREVYAQESQQAYDAFDTALSAQPFEEFDAANEALNECWIAYYNASIANSDYYNYAMGEYGYNTWASYGAPYYGTYVFLYQLYALLSDQYFTNYWDLARYEFNFPMLGTPEYEEMEAYREELDEYYMPAMKYYSAYSEYYRGLSDYFEG